MQIKYTKNRIGCISYQGRSGCMLELSILTLKHDVENNINHRIILEGLGGPLGPHSDCVNVSM